MKNKLFIFDLDMTILSLNISTKQLSDMKEEINIYFKKYNISHDSLRPLIPKIIFLSKVIDNKELQNKIIQDCFSIIDQVETNPDGGIELNQGNIDLLNDLHEKGLRIGIISNNGKKGALNALHKAKLHENLFTFVITRDDVFLPKPFIDPYLKISHYFNEYDCYLFTDDIFDFLSLINLEKINNWSIEKYVVLQMDIKNQSYNWVTANKMNFDML